MKKRRVTIKQIAEKAGVSVATVDRVINQRAPVQGETISRVLKAAEELGWQSNQSINLSQLSSAPQAKVRCGFLLQKTKSPFHQRLAEALERAVSEDPALNAEITIEFMDDIDPSQVAERMCQMGNEVDALGVVAVDHPFVSEAIHSLKQRDVPVIALLSDLSAPDLAGYVGSNTRAAGRTAAWALKNFTGGHGGAVALLIGSHGYLSQEEREIGFRSYLREKAPELKVLESMVCRDDPDMAYQMTRDLLASNPEIIGLFTAGGATSGTLRALKENLTTKKPFYVTIELTTESSNALVEGFIDLIISPDASEIARSAVQMLINAKHKLPQAETCRLPFLLYTSENI